MENTQIPLNWKTFLLADSNKTELFKFLASAIEITCRGKVLVATNRVSDISTAALYICLYRAVSSAAVHT